MNSSQISYLEISEQWILQIYFSLQVKIMQIIFIEKWNFKELNFVAL